MNKPMIWCCWLFISCVNTTNTDNSFLKETPNTLSHSINPNPTTQTIEPEIKALNVAFPEHTFHLEGDSLIMDSAISFSFGEISRYKDFDSLLNFPNLRDQFKIIYPLGVKQFSPPINFDPGRIRFEPLFKHVYGNNKQEVIANLDTLFWMPNISNERILFSKINGASDSLNKVMIELQSLPDSLVKYVVDIGGTFNWRTISGTSRLSAHSFGIAIDINVSSSDYWLWSSKNIDMLEYKNKVPISIVKIFEKYGFIWGGRWYHYDTMHFEFRPEILEFAKQSK